MRTKSSPGSILLHSNLVSETYVQYDVCFIEIRTLLSDKHSKNRLTLKIGIFIKFTLGIRFLLKN